MLQLSNITYRIGDRTLIDQASVSLPSGARAGLVGRNGAGKTTLFKIITGELPTEAGFVHMPRNSRIGQVAQEAPAGPESLIDVVLAADTERRDLLAAAETEADPHRIADIHQRLADIDAHSAEARGASILAGLGFDAEAQRRPCSEFSGGWRMRVALAAVLFSEPDLLLLDEPTNYLDLEGTLWLHGFIARYRNTVLLISHDRDLLDTAVNTIVHLDQGKLTIYRGGYTDFDRQRAERQSLQSKLRKKQLDHRRHMEAFVERFRAKATKAKQAQSRLKALARLEPISELVEERVMPFSIPNPARPAAPPIATFDDAAVGYEPDKPVLSGINMTIVTDDRIGLLGKNGNGKSTLARMLAGRLTKLSGRFKTSSRLKIGYFAQHQLDELRPAMSAYDQMRERLPDETEARVRARAGALGFPGRKMDTPASDLSGGEKARLLLGLAAYEGVDLLILDEPTNHLDVDSREALIMALNDFAGAVVIVSHDRHLLEATVDQFWLVGDGTVRPFDGDLDDYRDLILAPPAAGTKNARSSDGKPTARERRRDAAAKRAETADLRKTLNKTEKLVADLQKKIQRIDAAMADPETFQGDATAFSDKAKERAATIRELEATEARWLSLAEQLEAADRESADA